MNNYHRRLKIPVDFTFPDCKVPDTKRNYYCRFEKKSMNREFVKWIETIGLNVIVGEFFYTPPHIVPEDWLQVGAHLPHVDGHKITDIVKLIWMKGGSNSVMDWYELNSGVELTPVLSRIKTPVGFVDKENITLQHTAEIGYPSLANVGRVHGVRNGKEPRYVATVIVSDPQTKQQLQWPRAEKIFEQFVV